MCQLLHANLRSDSPPLLAVRPLAWGNIQHASNITSEFLAGANRSLTHIICSDLVCRTVFSRIEAKSRQVYFPNLFAPLLYSLIHLTSLSSSETPKIIMSYKIRSLSKEMPFWSAFGLWFEFSPVLARRRQGSWNRFNPSDSDDVVFIFVARRRPESFHWEIPANDSDLLAGWQTGTRKGDDTFESLLLMAMNDEDMK